MELARLEDGVREREGVTLVCMAGWMIVGSLAMYSGEVYSA